MKELKLVITAGEAPPSQQSIDGVHAALKDLQRSISGICSTAAGLALLGFFALEMKWTGSASGELAAEIAYAAGLMVFLGGRQYDGVIKRRIAEISTIDDSLLPEAAMLANSSAAARDYIKGLRAQNREMTLVELNALRKLAAATPIDTARQTLYG